MPPDTELKGVEGKYVYVTVLSGLNVLQPGASYYHGLKGEEEIQLYASVQVKGKISLCALLKRSSFIFLAERVQEGSSHFNRKSLSFMAFMRQYVRSVGIVTFALFCAFLKKRMNSFLYVSLLLHLRHF